MRSDCLGRVYDDEGEHEEEEAEMGERCWAGAVASHQVEERGPSEMIKMPLLFSLSFFWYQLVQINTSSLVRISNSKP